MCAREYANKLSGMTQFHYRMERLYNFAFIILSICFLTNSYI